MEPRSSWDLDLGISPLETSVKWAFAPQPASSVLLWKVPWKPYSTYQEELLNKLPLILIAAHMEQYSSGAVLSILVENAI